MASPYKYRNLPDMFFSIVAENPEKVGYMSKIGESYKSTKFSESGRMVENLALGLIGLGVGKQDKVAIMSTTREEWAYSDYAIMSAGGVVVTVYPNIPSNQVEFILQNSESKVVIVSDAEQLEKINSIKAKTPDLQYVIVMDSDVSKTHDYVLHLSELAELGEKGVLGSHKHDKDRGYLEKLRQEIDGDEVMTIIYTSGTTGVPKGVMLTHNNLLSNVSSSLKGFPVTKEDTFLSFLPLSHVFERMAGHYLATFSGATIAYAVSIDTVAENIGEIKPTLMASVPRLYEKMYARILDNVASAPAIRRAIFNWGVNAGREAKATGKRGFKYNLASKLVFSKLKERFGGRIKFFISGGAALSKEIGEFFDYMDIKILEGYGLTETSPVISVNRLEKYKFGSVGQVIADVDVKFGPDGEICVKGPNVMVGYYKNEEATREVMDDEGYFHTGDIGMFDEDGMLVITDRKKNLIVTSGGKNVAPQLVENLLITSQYVEQVMVIGDKRNFISALIVPVFDKLKEHATKSGLSFKDEEELVKLPEINKLVFDDVEKLQGTLANHEKVKKISLLSRAFSIQSGELTPTLKIKRNVVTEKFLEAIEDMYKPK